MIALLTRPYADFARRSPDLAVLARGLAAYGGGEIATRAVRIVAIVVIARHVDAVELGTAALALSLFELVRVLANAGIGQRIIAAADAELDAVCVRAAQLFWFWCAAVAGVQLSVAGVLWAGFALPVPAAMLAVLALVYLIMPPGLVQVFLLMRDGRLAVTARNATAQTICDHILTMLLAALWPSAWAIVLPKLMTAPLWTILTRRARPWRCPTGIEPAPLASFMRYGAGVLGSELGAAARAQLGNLVVGATLGIKALGLFYFAFGAGLGITASFVSAFTIVLFPHLCAARGPDEIARRTRRGMAFGLAAMLPVILAQVLLAPFYVPILFGAHWAEAAPLVSLLGLGALPLVAGAAMTAALRASRRTGLDAAISLASAAAAIGGLWLGSGHGLDGAAMGYVAGLALVVVPAALILAWPRRPVPAEAAV
ncbi:oligosaccharide flippase family protein [Sphingomonas sp. SUN039]|uniref:oligosaccharide flippase family protein n=1 Tax=Sphingomonas sp. SUN039 TaxID=2937787 RepID=UPI0021648375|nr:oligosaccharide flippase family protein [Sphingomonas sp. SUN039]UVO52749.1 oligosaccharide flippase family protein [Sphingomonas sp. SUN039]